jgi:hypothetical protein
MWGWLRLGRRRYAIPEGIWTEALRHIPYAATLPAADQERLRALVLRFLRAKTFEGAAGLQVTDGMRVHVALQACLLVLNLDFDYYAGWHAVILYPGDFRVPKELVDEAGVVHHWTEELAGESWEQGPVILSWDASAVRDPDMNIVLHEFAHKLDMLDGVANGCPPLPADIAPDDWRRDLETAYERFCTALDHQEPVDLDDYAAESPAEFFAVLSEMFFLQPRMVQTDFPEVYRQLRAFYRQDPLHLPGTA